MLTQFADLLAYDLFGLDPKSRIGAQSSSFCRHAEDLPVACSDDFVIGFVRTWLPQSA